MPMTKVPKGTRRVRRTNQVPEVEWDIMLDLHAVGWGEGEVNIGYTERRGSEQRAFPIHAITWQDFRKWIPAVAWLVECYKAHLNTSEPASAADTQHVAQQSQAQLSGEASAYATESAQVRTVTDLDEAADLDWLTEPAQQADGTESAEEE